MTYLGSLSRTGRVCSVFLVSIVVVGTARGDEQPQCHGQPYVLVTGLRATNTNDGAFEIELKYKKGTTSKSSTNNLSATIKSPDTSKDAAEAIRDALNGDTATNGDWNFAVVQMKDEPLTWLCIGTRKAEDVSPCGWDNQVGSTPSGGLSISGLNLGSAVDPVVGDVLYDIFGVPSAGNVELQAEGHLISVGTAGKTLSQIKAEFIQEFNSAGVPAQLVGEQIIIEDTNVDVMSGGGALFGTTDPTIGGRTAIAVSCGVRIPTVSEWGVIVVTLLLLTAGTIVLARRCRRAAA